MSRVERALRGLIERCDHALAAGVVQWPELAEARAALGKSDPGIRPGAEEKTGLTATPRKLTGEFATPPFRIDEMGPKGTQSQTHTQKGCGDPICDNPLHQDWETKAKVAIAIARRLAVLLETAEESDDRTWREQMVSALSVAKEAGLL